MKSLGRSKGSGGFFVNRPHRQIFFFSRYSHFYIQSGFFLFYSGYPILSLISPPLPPRRLDFLMQRYSGRPASSTTMLTARGFARQPSANRRWPFSPPPRTSTGWVFREILRPFCFLSVLSPAVWLACKISPAQGSRKGSESREKKKSKFNKIKKILKVMHSKIFSNYRNTGEQGQLPERGHPHAGRR